MRITISFHEEKDKDIIDYIKGRNRTYKIRESIRKAMQFDRWMEKILAKGLNSESVKLDNEEEALIETTKEAPQMSEEEIDKKLSQF